LNLDVAEESEIKKKIYNLIYMTSYTEQLNRLYSKESIIYFYEYYKI